MRGRKREDSGSRGNRRGLGRRDAGGNAVAHGAGGQAPHLRHQAGPAGRTEGALPPATATLDYQDIIKNDNISVVYISTTPESNHYPIARDCLQGRQARDAGEADRAGAVGGRRADHARQAQQPEIHHRLFAALQHQDRLRQEEDRRRHARQGGVGAGEPASVAGARQEDREPRAAVAGGDGIDARPRFRDVAAGAGKARAGLFAGRLRLHGADQRLARRDVHHRDDGQRRGGDDRRRLEFPGELSELLLDLDRDHRHRRRAGARRHPARQLAQHREDRPGVPDVDHAGRAGRPRVRRRHGAGDDPFPRSLHPEQAGDGDAGERAAW